ncbi:DUF4150 domain-containing protein [Planctobacterium marinum]|uniref:DUF4150 domain-containing protein n=1 Tax=Planctobacterium marinum TaxID=1631968 RepID=UPI001E63561B|nr:DUF4150 domain-containing protein [Planctobacterium marinum]MCC2604026.1 DUF4150 domain-containing protein [Planctobacterium marinum]
MFCKTQMFALSLGFPDVCKIVTPVGPVPIPLPNFAFSTLAIPTIYNHFITAMPVHNLATTTAISSGNEVSAPMGGVVSNQFIGSKRNLLGSFKTFFQCMPCTRMLDLSGQNGLLSNIPGLNLSPSQVKVMVLT